MNRTGFATRSRHITNFGLSGWFLIPFAAIVLCLAAVISPALSRRSQGVLTALAARFGFLFLAIGVPGLFVAIVKRLIGRARPYVGGGGHDDPFLYMPFVWRPEYASMPSGHATTAVSAAIAIGAIWPRTRFVMWLYALIIMVSRVCGAGASSERRHCRRADRRRWRLPGAALVCGAAAGVLRARSACLSGAVVAADQGGAW